MGRVLLLVLNHRILRVQTISYAPAFADLEIGIDASSITLFLPSAGLNRRVKFVDNF